MLLPTPRLPALAGGPALGWAVLAPGAIATAFTNSLHTFTDQRVVAVGSRTRERAEGFARTHGIASAYDSYEAAVADPAVEIVYVAAPHTQHLPLALLAIAAGKHVLIEKPLAPSEKEAAQIVTAARAAGVFAMEAMHTRFHPWVDVANQLIADGAIGAPRFVSAEVGRLFAVDPASRLFDPALAGGALLDMGVYAVWFALHFAGEPASVLAQGELTSTGVDSQATIILRGPGGAHSTVSSTIEAFTPSRASISGNEGRIEVDGRFPMPNPLSIFDRDNTLVARFEDTSGLVGHDGLARQAAWAAIHIADGLTEAPQHPLSASLAQLRVIDSARAQVVV
jgi:predicted dehydrogenase